ncbi:MAG: 4a-hydroxytetrahydrobiopterin dehydratase [Gallionella sp.]
MSTLSNLSDKTCKPCEGGVPPLSNSASDNLMEQLEGWQRDGQLISKTYQFKDYYQTMAFVNAIAWVSHRENHHPDLKVTYNSCQVDYTTHAVHGLSENDFICAAKVDALFAI